MLKLTQNITILNPPLNLVFSYSSRSSTQKCTILFASLKKECFAVRLYRKRFDTIVTEECQEINCKLMANGTLSMTDSQADHERSSLND